jgi:exonuclease SbcC
MIPIRITIEGLYSYQKKQMIEFKELTTAKLFGIFGAVGSGKTTILEAISLALYGKCEKLTKLDGLGYNLMNLKSNQLYIEYEFKTFYDEYYKFIYQTKRKKNFTETQAIKRSAYQKVKNEWQPISTSSTPELLGLHYDYFKRTIIVPQGKFQEFLQLTAKDRTEMLKDIFSLQRFDLYDKAAVLNKKNNNQIKHIEGQLTSLSSVSQELINDKKQQLATLQKQLIDTSTQYKQQQENLEKQQALHELFIEIHKQEKILQKLLAKKDQFHQLEQKVTQFEVCYKQFSVLLSQYDTKQTELTQLTQQLQSIQKTLVQAENKANKAQSTVDKAQTEIEQLQQVRDELQQNALDIVLLGEIKVWIQQKNYLLEQVQQYQNKINGLQQKLSDIEQQKQTVLSEQLQHYAQTDWQTLNLQQLVNKLVELIAKFEDEMSQIEQKLDDLSIKAKLEQHAQNLHAGEACPLCGSLEHPNPLQQTDIKAQLKHSQSQKATLKQHINFCRQQQTVLQELATKTQMQQQLLVQNQQDCQQQQQALANHEQQFIWADFQHLSASDIEQQYEQANQQKQQLSSLQKQLDTKQKALDKAKHTFSTQQNELSQLQGKINTSQAYEQTYQQQLQEIDKRITKQLQQTQYTTIEQVKLILSSDLAIDKERAKINQFNQDVHTAQQQLQHLHNKTDGQQFDESQFKQLKQLVDKLSNTVDQHKKSIITLEHEIKRFQQNLQTKQQLQQDLSALKQREANLKVLLNLFKGNGFVNYVSTVFLQNLVNAANQRFVRLTRQKLRLELNDKNEFEVRDYMNGGQLRSIKTLSGGQIFQASLSLALALSDSIQKNSQTTQNFFFLDEGFGSQDRESLQLVFETLKSLRHENKIVGIISHVDDLKQELDYYLLIKNTEKQGSIVQYHWQ